MAGTLSSGRSAVQGRLAEYFRGRQTRAGVLARRLLQIEDPNDRDLVEHLIRERRRKTRIDGSVDGGLVATAWLCWELLQLEAPTDNAGVVRTVGFLLGRQDQPGRVFGEGCRPYTHERRLCSHYIGGFFSAGPEESPIAPLSLPTGGVIPIERDARFAASCLALRTVMRAGHDGREAVHRHVASLLDLAPLWSGRSGDWAPDLVFFALGAVALAPLDLRPPAGHAAAQVTSRQQADGSWPGVDPFLAADMLLNVATAEARGAVRRTAPRLTELVQDDATLAGEPGEERGLIALRALAA